MGIASLFHKITSSLNNQPGPQLGRNEPCWCGSGEKYKRCHLATDERKRASARSAGTSAPAGRGF